MRTVEESQDMLQECLKYKIHCDSRGCVSSKNEVYIHCLEVFTANNKLDTKQILKLWECYDREITPIRFYQDRIAKQNVADEWYRKNRNKKGSMEKYTEMLPKEYDEYTWAVYDVLSWIMKDSEKLI